MTNDPSETALAVIDSVVRRLAREDALEGEPIARELERYARSCPEAAKTLYAVARLVRLATETADAEAPASDGRSS